MTSKALRRVLVEPLYNTSIKIFISPLSLLYLQKVLLIHLKEQSRPSVSNVTSADVRLTTILGTATSLASVMKRLKTVTDRLPKLFNEMDKTDPLKKCVFYIMYKLKLPSPLRVNLL